MSRVATASLATGTVEIRSQNHDGIRVVEAIGFGFFDWLDQELADTEVESSDLPFDFRLGWVGYLGYELKTEVGSPNSEVSDLPDAVMTFLDRSVVIDHFTERIHLVALRCPNRDDSVSNWFDQMATRIATIAVEEPIVGGIHEARPVVSLSTNLFARHSRSDYLDLIERAQKYITDGETYEVCLTNILESGMSKEVEAVDALQSYLCLRADNPTPFGAFIRTQDATLLSTSPERFLCINADGRVESKPIKGTRPRGATPAEDEAIRAELHTSIKDRCENLMIVDLVRHDLGRTAELGSVRVNTLFGIESYATVHQMVSTVSSRLAADQSPVSCVRAAFPPGSMTGAPKQRTMSIIDELECGPRGAYSGAIGYFSLNGAVDLSVVIRALVLGSDTLRYGIGGAIVAMSDSDEEYRETVLKATPLVRLFDEVEFPTGEEFRTVIPINEAPGMEQTLPDHDQGAVQ